MKKVAIFGGTFNPIHNGHINTAIYLKNYLLLDKIILVPTNISPHKSMSQVVSSYDRYEMCCIAAKEYDFLEVSNIEILRNGLSYTIDTIKIFRKSLKDEELYTIVGADMFMTIQDWKNSADIFREVTICSVPREDISYEILMDHSINLRKYGAKSIIVNAPIIDISSSLIRKMISKNINVDALMPRGVMDYIRKNKLYFG